MLLVYAKIFQTRPVTHVLVECVHIFSSVLVTMRHGETPVLTCACCTAAAKQVAGKSQDCTPRWCDVGNHRGNKCKYKAVFKDSDGIFKVYTSTRLYTVLSTAPLLTAPNAPWSTEIEHWCCNACYLSADKTEFGAIRKGKINAARDGSKSAVGAGESQAEESVLLRSTVAGLKRRAEEAELELQDEKRLRQGIEESLQQDLIAAHEVLPQHCYTCLLLHTQLSVYCVNCLASTGCEWMSKNS